MGQALLTVAQAAEHLNTTERHVRRLIDERRIEFIRIGRKIRISSETLNAFIDRGRVPPTIRAGRVA
jgi:excisionase family DNA binding protein